MKRTSRNPSTLSESLQRHLNAYALAASAAGVGMLALAQPAEAKIVYTKTHKIINWKHRIFNLDLNHDRMADFRFKFHSGLNLSWSVGIHPASSGTMNQVWGSGRLSAAALHAGVVVGSDGRFRPSYYIMFGCGSTVCGGNWLNVRDRYLGLKFLINGMYHYGWARLSTYRYVTAMLTGYAYETIPGKAIIAGKTKGPDVITLEPSSLGALAAGASGRSRRK